MKLLKDKILRDGKVYPGGVLKVDNFLNHRIDIQLLDAIGEEFYRRLKDEKITMILTVEASGIAVACMTARHFNVPVLFAKKNKTSNLSNDVYSAQVDSYTHGTTYNIVVSRDYISSSDRILIIDDFLAKGNAIHGLISIANQAGATVVAAGAVIEKSFQGGGDSLRENGIRIETLASVRALTDDGNIVFDK